PPHSSPPFPSLPLSPLSFLFFFNHPATPEIYPLSLHDALPIFERVDGTVALRGRVLLLPVHGDANARFRRGGAVRPLLDHHAQPDRKSTRLNSSHVKISYAVFCLKKKKQTQHHSHEQSHAHTSY